jgi:hypothetical protein
MRVEVYFNLHRKLWSVRDLSTGLVVDHVDEITIQDPSFTVQPAGRRKVIREGRKNVHAFVRGERIESPLLWFRPQVDDFMTPRGGVPVYYNPYKCCQDCGTLELCAGLDTCRASFITKPEGAPIHGAGLATLSGRAVTAYIQE